MTVNRLTERMLFQGAEQKRNKHRLLLLIDEFPSVNRMEVFADALSYMAGYGLKAYLITPDIRQIVDAYRNNVWVEREQIPPSSRNRAQHPVSEVGVGALPRSIQTRGGEWQDPASMTVL